MEKNKILSKLEQDLTSFLVSEVSKGDPDKRNSPEAFRYKGLTISTNEHDKGDEKAVCIRIGPLEAQYRVDSGEKMQGALPPDDERLVKMWMKKSENVSQFKAIFNEGEFRRKILPIVPFDLENFYK